MSCRKQRILKVRLGLGVGVGLAILSWTRLGFSQAAPEPVPVVPIEIPFQATPPATEDPSRLKGFLENQSVQKFTGKPITLQVRDAEVADVLRLVSEASGFNIVVGDDVKGKVTLSLIDVPWDQALDVVLHTARLGAERNNNVLRVVTLSNLTTEKLEEQRAIEAAAARTPKITRVIPVNYASLKDLQVTLQKFSSIQSSEASSASGPAGASSGTSSSASSANSASVQVDSRTNSVILYDLPERIERMKKLIEILDTQTPQVVIEAKIIEATEGFSKSLGGSLGVGGSGSTSFVASAAGGNPIDPLLGSPGVFGTGTDVATASNPTGGSPAGVFGLSPSLSFIPGVSRLNAILNWGENENQVKIVSSPKTVVLNKQKASIVEGTPVLVPGTTTVAGVGTIPTQNVQNANISLAVTPTVTNDGSVLLDVTVTKDVPLSVGNGQQGIGNRNMTTQVLVESGSTLVIGGIYTMQTSHSSAGIPFLRKIPIIGVLFGSESDTTSRDELFIFITPRILNPKETGLTS